MPKKTGNRQQSQNKERGRQWVQKKRWRRGKRRIMRDAEELDLNLLFKEGAQKDEDEDEDNGAGVAETYANYMPSKLKLGIKHPDPVVESASLSSVEPTDIWYDLSIPGNVIETGALSALQIESIVYASQQHERFLQNGTRAGFLIGDGAGVGKGRTIAGIIFENYLKGRKKSLWVSASNDLKYDAERDLKDIGASKIKVHALNQLKYYRISSDANGSVNEGVIFSTYSALISKTSRTGAKLQTRLSQLIDWCGKDFDGLIVFDECHRAKNLCLATFRKPTQTGLTVLELQKRLPKARVVYASATGAPEPRNMAYMTRLGMWGQGTEFTDVMTFISAVEKRGVGVMEVVAMDMKLRGMYIARQLSFHGVTFRVEEVQLNEEFIRMYDDSVKLWVCAREKFFVAATLVKTTRKARRIMWAQFWASHQRFFKYLCVAAKVKVAVSVAREAVKCGKCVVIGLQSTGEAGTLEQLEKDEGELLDFVSTAKGVLQALVEKQFPAPEQNSIQGLDKEVACSNRKRKPVKAAAQLAMKRVKLESSDECVMDCDVRAWRDEFCREDSNSGESTVSSDDSAFCDSDSDSDIQVIGYRSKKRTKKWEATSSIAQSTQDCKAKLLGMKTPKTPVLGKRKGNGNGNAVPEPPSPVAIKQALYMRKNLLAEIEILGERLPPNSLDQLIDELGGPDKVAEMTGRKGRVVQRDDNIQFESRSEVHVPLETLNLTEKQRFMDGEKVVAIISEAASSGISLQSDRRVKNQRRRVHITLELPWSADRAIQQFGRTHRSNQVNAPEYIFLISDLAGERRFASVLARRLENLGALTHGDRRATEAWDLSRFDIDNKYGRKALQAIMRTILGSESPLVPPPQDYKGNFFKDVSDALDCVRLNIKSKETCNFRSIDWKFRNMKKFLNRILGMPVDLQNRLFKYFTDTQQAIIRQAKRVGLYDLGILDLGTSGENVKRVKQMTFLRKYVTRIAGTTTLHTVEVERGVSWAEATAKYQELVGANEGFYVSDQIRNNKRTSVLAVAADPYNTVGAKEKDILYVVYRPNTGRQLRQETLAELRKKYKKITKDEAEFHWTQQYESSQYNCSHAFWNGNCKNRSECDIGMRRRTYNVLAGSVLSVWMRIEKALSNSKMQVVRMRTSEGFKIIGPDAVYVGCHQRPLPKLKRIPPVCHAFLTCWESKLCKYTVLATGSKHGYGE